MKMNEYESCIIGNHYGLLTPSVRKSQIESCFSMTLSPLWVAGLEGTCTWSGVFHLHHHPINTHARPSPAEFMNGTIHLKGISGYLGLRIVIFQTTIVVSEIYNQLLMQQESWYYQAKQCTTRSTSIFQKNLPQKITVQILASSLIPPPQKKKKKTPISWPPTCDVTRPPTADLWSPQTCWTASIARLRKQLMTNSSPRRAAWPKDPPCVIHPLLQLSFHDLLIINPI